MENNKITIEVVVKASLDKVWKCFTSEKCIILWNFASPDWCCPWAKNDLRRGWQAILDNFKSHAERDEG